MLIPAPRSHRFISVQYAVCHLVYHDMALHSLHLHVPCTYLWVHHSPALEPQRFQSHRCTLLLVLVFLSLCYSSKPSDPQTWKIPEPSPLPCPPCLPLCHVLSSLLAQLSFQGQRLDVFCPDTPSLASLIFHFMNLEKAPILVDCNSLPHLRLYPCSWV